MSNYVQEIKIYLFGKRHPKIIKDTIDGFHSQIHVNVPRNTNWRPLHRDVGPSVEYEDGGFEFWQNGQLHNVDGPAIYYPSKNQKSYYLFGGSVDEVIFEAMSGFLRTVKYFDLVSNKFSGQYYFDDIKTKITLKNGVLHNDNGPAVEIGDDFQLWFINGMLHRLNGPAVSKPDHIKEYWMYGKRRRPYSLAPVVLCDNTNGSKWLIDDQEMDLDQFLIYLKKNHSDKQITLEDDKVIFVKDGVPHNDDGPAIIWFNGSLEWRTCGKLHRSNGPAVMASNGTLMWYNNGKRHRLDGPAIEFPSRRKAWYIDGTRIRRKEYNDKVSEFQEKEIILKDVEMLLSDISAFHFDNIKEIDSQRLDMYLNDIDGVFNKMLNMDVDVDGIKLDLIKELDNEESLSMDPVESEKELDFIDSGWAVPILSVAVASFLGAFKRKKIKSKKEEQVVTVKENVAVY